jgi:hypothetical protein
MEIENQVSQFSGDSIVVGDFNLPRLYSSQCVYLSASDSTFSEVFDSLGLEQMVVEPTRLSNILDLVLTNDQQLVTKVSVGQPFSFSDHNRITFSINVSPNIQRSVKDCGLNYSRGDYLKINEFMSSVNWDSLFWGADVNEMWCIFKDFLTYAMYMYIPRHSRKESKVRWSAATKCLYNRKLERWRQYSRTKNHEDKVAYETAAKVASNSASADISSLEENILNSKSIRRFYGYVNSNLSSRNNIPPLWDQHSSALVFDSQTKTNLFQDQFSSVFTDDNGIFPPFGYRTDARLEFIDITEMSVLRALKSLPNKVSAGPDSLPSIVLKHIAASISAPLTSIFRRSFETGHVPDDWLTSNITPIYKNKGHNELAASYRPISLGSVPSKVMEYIVKDGIQKFLDKESLISSKQHGFMKGKSTVTNVLTTLNNWKSSRLQNQQTHVCYIDFAKAFDSISHKKLLYKLERYGLCGRLLRWINAFLTGRTQYVAYDGCLSRSSPVISGVPQGTVLGPLLFTVFVNDLPDHVMFSEIALYADDSKVFKAISDNLSFQQFQSDLERIYRWSELWQLPIAALKCSVFVFGPSLNAPNPHYTMGNIDLDYVDCVKDLGFMISGDNKFSAHCVMVAKKAQRVSSLIFRCFRNRNISFLLKMFNVYVRSIVESGTVVWSPYLLKDIKLIERVQRVFTKRLPGMSHLTYTERLEYLGLRSLEYRRIIFDLELTYKIIRNLSSLKFDDFFKYAPDSSTRSHSLRLALPTAMPRYLQNCFAHRVPRIWNALPNNVVSSPSLSTFKKRLELVNLNQFVLNDC